MQIVIANPDYWLAPKKGVIDAFENLTFESVNPGGYNIASFDIHIDVKKKQKVFEPFNYVVIYEGPTIVWQGYIDTPERSVKPDTITINCLGYSARLNQVGYGTDITVSGAANNQMSDFITGTMLADTDISDFIDQGTVETGDYAYPNTTRFEFSPWTSYFDCLEQFNAGNNWDYGVWANEKDLAKGKFDFTEPDTEVDWYVSVQDCDSIRISPDIGSLFNYVIVSYTQDSVHQQTITLQDTTSQNKYGRTIQQMISVPGRITTGVAGPPPTGAYAIGQTFLDDHKDLKVYAEFTTKKVYNHRGSPVPMSYVRGGDVVKVVDWFPTSDILIDEVDDVATFKIKSARYNHDGPTLDITPTQYVPQVEVELARLSATGY